jgi:hypothetical protein
MQVLYFPDTCSLFHKYMNSTVTYVVPNVVKTRLTVITGKIQRECLSRLYNIRHILHQNYKKIIDLYNVTNETGTFTIKSKNNLFLISINTSNTSKHL